MVQIAGSSLRGPAMHLMLLGGTGFAGRALIRQLQRERGTDITVVSRTTYAMPGVRRVVTGDYRDLVAGAAFRREMRAVDALVHLGDGLSVLQHRGETGNAARADRLVAAAADLASAVREAQVPLFVYVSSIKALCDEEDGRVLAEDSEPRGSTLYGRSKLRVEQSVSSVLSESATRHVILRIPVMYGEGGTGSFQRLLKLADTPLPLPLDGLRNRRSVLATRNFASLLALVLRTGPPHPHGVFHVHDGPPWSTTRIVTTLRAALGRPRRLFGVGEVFGHAFRRAPFVGPIARRLYGSLELSDARLRRSFAWTAVVDTQAALFELARNSRAPP